MIAYDQRDATQKYIHPLSGHQPNHLQRWLRKYGSVSSTLVQTERNSQHDIRCETLQSHAVTKGILPYTLAPFRTGRPKYLAVQVYGGHDREIEV